MSPPEDERMEPQNGDLEDEFPFQLGDFEVPAINDGLDDDLDGEYDGLDDDFPNSRGPVFSGSSR